MQSGLLDEGLKCQHNTNIMISFMCHVFDGGSLIQGLSWKRGDTFKCHCNSWVDYVQRKYITPIIEFDGYKAGPSTKDTTHLWRRHGLMGAQVNFSGGCLSKQRKSSPWPINRNSPSCWTTVWKTCWQHMQKTPWAEIPWHASTVHISFYQRWARKERQGWGSWDLQRCGTGSWRHSNFSSLLLLWMLYSHGTALHRPGLWHFDSCLTTRKSNSCWTISPQAIATSLLTRSHGMGRGNGSYDNHPLSKKLDPRLAPHTKAKQQNFC